MKKSPVTKKAQDLLNKLKKDGVPVSSIYDYLSEGFDLKRNRISELWRGDDEATELEMIYIKQLTDTYNKKKEKHIWLEYPDSSVLTNYECKHGV